jgi:hypothetical protein
VGPAIGRSASIRPTSPLIATAARPPNQSGEKVRISRRIVLVDFHELDAVVVAKGMLTSKA